MPWRSILWCFSYARCFHLRRRTRLGCLQSDNEIGDALILRAVRMGRPARSTLPTSCSCITHPKSCPLASVAWNQSWQKLLKDWMNACDSRSIFWLRLFRAWVPKICISDVLLNAILICSLLFSFSLLSHCVCYPQSVVLGPHLELVSSFALVRLILSLTSIRNPLSFKIRSLF